MTQKIFYPTDNEGFLPLTLTDHSHDSA